MALLVAFQLSKFFIEMCSVHILNDLQCKIYMGNWSCYLAPPDPRLALPICSFPHPQTDSSNQ